MRVYFRVIIQQKKKGLLRLPLFGIVVVSRQIMILICFTHERITDLADFVSVEEAEEEELCC